MEIYRELYKQIENGREVIGKIGLVDGKIVYENIPESLQKDFENYGVRAGGDRYTSKINPTMFFSALPFMFVRGRIRVSEIKEGE